MRSLICLAVLALLAACGSNETGDDSSTLRAGVNKSHPGSRREGYGAQWRDWANQQPNQYTCRTVGR